MFSLESRPFSDHRITLEKARRLVGRKTGVIKELYELLLEPDDLPMFIWRAELADTSRYSPLKSFSGTGCATTRGMAQAKAVGEAVERYCAGMYMDEDLILAPYRAVASDAMDPRTLPLCSEREYTHSYSYLSRFAEDAPIKWVEGYSLTKQRTILVPACFVFVPYRFHSPAEGIYIPLSTGLACANSLEEATFSGLCEVVERDAIMIMWLNRLSMPKVALASAGNERIRALLEKWTGCHAELHVINITTDVGIPTFFTVAVDQSGNGPAAIVGAATHLDPEIAIAKSIEEAAHGYFYAKSLMKQRPAFAQEINCANVKSLEDHALLYCAPTGFARLQFVYGCPQEIEVDSLPNRFSEHDVLANIRTCLDLLAAKGLEVIVVDITTPDIVDLGFRVVRVLIPGMQPLSIGTQHLYLGGQRLYQVPYVLGYTGAPTTEDSVNREPHPFP